MQRNEMGDCILVINFYYDTFTTSHLKTVFPTAAADGNCAGGNNPTVTGEWLEGVYSANVNGGLFSAFAYRSDQTHIDVCYINNLITRYCS